MCKISVLIPTFNCEETIRDCLDSIKWADRIFVVDSFSTDNTLAICKEYTNWIVQHEYINSKTQKNWALEQIVADPQHTEWVFEIDSDEVMEDELRDEIQHRFSQEDVPDGFLVPIKNMIWGKWVMCCGYYPCSQIRLFKVDLGRWSDREVHARVQGLSRLDELHNHLIHYDLTDLSKELVQFSKQVMIWESNELVKKGRRWRWIDVTLRPMAIFFVLYFRQNGYREGFRGFYLSVWRAFYCFMTYAHLFEYEIKNGIRQ